VPTMEKPHVVRCLVLAALLLAPTLAAAQTAGDTSTTGRRVSFDLTRFDDTLFTAIDAALRVRFDESGHVWYTTEGGLVHVDPVNKTRELYTKVEGLPSSYALGLDIEGRHVYVGTDLGLAILDRHTGEIRKVTPFDSPLPDIFVQDVLVLGDQLWIGTRFAGVAIWDMRRDVRDEQAWTLKNTSTRPDYPKAVTRLVETPTAIYATTDGDGLWRYDRATAQWTVTVQADGLPTNEITSVAEREGELWVGTLQGLARRSASGQWRVYNASHGMPEARVHDVDILPTVEGTLDVFAATRRGVWQLEPASGRNGTRAQDFGILGAYIFDMHFEEDKGWLFATSRGISYLREGEWSYYATGPTDGRSWGPLSFGFTSASVGDSRGFLWFGSSRGLSAYALPGNDRAGFWQNFGPWQKYPGSVVNWIDTDGNVTWFATNSGTYGFEHETGRWIPKLATGSRNLVYGLEADRGELWIALFGDGLRMENLTTGVSRTWTFQTALSPLPDQLLTDVRADGDTIWLGASVGLIRMDRATGTFRGTYTQADGLPGAGVVFRVEPDGAIVWVGTSNGGVARFDVGAGRVTRVWNSTTEPGFPDGQVRSLHREGGRLWVGTNEGLARIDINTGRWQAWNQSNSDLVQNYVNGITSAQGLLYLATLSGVQRFDIATSRFLPLHDGPGVVRVEAGAEAFSPTRVTIRVDAPRDGGAITGLTQVRGSALAFGGAVERVEVRVGEGEFKPAQGTESWTYDLDASTLPANEPVTITIRGFAGQLTGQAEIVVTPVAPPTVPLSIEEIPPGDAYANRPFRLAARAQGDEPLSVTAFYRAPGASGYTRLPMARAGDLFTASIPARDMREGELRYYLEAQSGLLFLTAAGDAGEPTLVDVLPAPRLAVALEGPAVVEARAGEETRFPLQVINAGTQAATFRVEASGLRAAWVLVPPEDVALGPGETRELNVRIVVPEAAFADNTTLSFVARDATGQADAATASVPVRILAAPTPTTPTATSQGGGGSLIPFPPLVALAAVALALVLRGRRS